MKTITFAITIILLLIEIPASADNTENTCNLQHPEWSRTAVMYEANIRQFTKEGTFKAFAQHLPRLKKMGVDVIWLMPIHPISKVTDRDELFRMASQLPYTGASLPIHRASAAHRIAELNREEATQRRSE